eukprot:TRINITY_DN35465_c0_g1_i1.p1 TRINITY_DN35465_c0_g1~~TRINITY_DN35465_c0_g1_i1.p1  ORF type:complete len:961 (-),score=313.41 TRINITY_DN35465_c0_g1_i1:101-2983(-)
METVPNNNCPAIEDALLILKTTGRIKGHIQRLIDCLGRLNEHSSIQRVIVLIYNKKETSKNKEIIQTIKTATKKFDFHVKFMSLDPALVRQYGEAGALMSVRKCFDHPFLLVQAFNEIHKNTIRLIQDHRCYDKMATLMVDTNLCRKMDHVEPIRMVVEKNRIKKIAVDLDCYNTVSTGITLLKPGVFDYLRKLLKADKQFSLNECIVILTKTLANKVLPLFTTDADAEESGEEADDGKHHTTNVILRQRVLSDTPVSACQMIIVGDGDALGHWKPSSGLKMSCVSADLAEDVMTLTWKAEVSVQPDKPLRYKYALKEWGYLEQWEAKISRQLDCEDGELPETVDDGWFGCGIDGDNQVLDFGWVEEHFEMRVKLGTWQGDHCISLHSDQPHFIRVRPLISPHTSIRVMPHNVLHVRARTLNELGLFVEIIASNSEPKVPPKPEGEGYAFSLENCKHNGVNNPLKIKKSVLSLTNTAPRVEVVSTFCHDAEHVIGSVVISPQDVKQALNAPTLSDPNHFIRPICYHTNTMCPKLIGEFTASLLVVAPFAHKKAKFTRRNRKSFEYPNHLNIGHRGFGNSSRYALGGRSTVAENTLLSFETADRHGIPYVEFDVQLSSDGVCVIYHNFELDLNIDNLHLKVPLQGLKADEMKKLQKTLCSANDGLYLPLFKNTGGTFGNGRRGGLQSPARRTRSVADFDISQMGKDRWAVHDELATLHELLEKLPQWMGFNIELKFPPLHERAHNVAFPSIHKYLSAVLKCVFDHHGHRPIIFSSFEPNIAVACSLMQVEFPVFLLTEAGQGRSNGHDDQRCNRLYDALQFASSCSLQGVVSECSPIFCEPSLIGEAHRLDLMLFTYGDANNYPENAKFLRSFGIDAVIADHIPKEDSRNTSVADGLVAMVEGDSGILCSPNLSGALPPIDEIEDNMGGMQIENLGFDSSDDDDEDFDEEHEERTIPVLKL